MNFKQGSARDVIFIIIVVFGLGLGTFIAHFMMNTGIDAMQNVTVINESASTMTALDSAQEISGRFDYIIFSVFIAMVLVLLITSWLVGGHPIFMFIFFFFVIIGVVLAAVLSNTWEQVTQASVFNGNAANFPITNHLMSYLPIYSAIIGVLGIIIMFAKPFLVEQG